MNNKYAIFYDNTTGRVIINRPKLGMRSNTPKKNNNEFDDKMEELYKFTNTDIYKNKGKDEISNFNEQLSDNIKQQSNNFKPPNSMKQHYTNSLNNKQDITSLNNKQKIVRNDLTYGIKKTILSDFNYLYNSSNKNDFIIGLNKNLNKNNSFFDSFYLFPNISEINTKNETNIINEKIIDIFKNNIDTYDSQYFPLDFIPCGINIPLKSKNSSYKKIIIKNIYWNIFQSINIENYKKNELLGVFPNKSDFSYTNISLQINFELHSQVSNNIIEKFGDVILPYRNSTVKNITPANSCLYKVLSLKVDTLDGYYFNDIEIRFISDLDIKCALLCVRISVPDESINILKGIDKNNYLFYGNIPFSQFIINFDYELVEM